MGDFVMRYFRTNPQTYAVLQPAIDEAFRAEFIASGRCEHILPVKLPVQSDGLCYLALAEWMTGHPNAGAFLQSVEEVDEKTYMEAQPKE